MTDPYRIKRVITKLGDIWANYPKMSFGQLVEQIENTAWARYYEQNPTRFFSGRWANLSDEALEWALNRWAAGEVKPVSAAQVEQERINMEIKT